MKLKEKLAFDYTDTIPVDECGVFSGFEARCFIAGFDKAKELLIKADKVLMMSPDEYLTADDFSKLGEEEV